MSTFAIPRSVEWRETHVTILNQQKLPSIIEYIDLHTLEDVYEAIATLKVRGAPAIGITAAYGLALAALRYDTESLDEFRRRLKRDRDYLASARPTAVNLFWALDRLVTAAADALSVNEAKTALIHEAIRIQVEDEDVCRRIGEYALSLFRPGDRVMTICNAGSIATARYGTALAPVLFGERKRN